MNFKTYFFLLFITLAAKIGYSTLAEHRQKSKVAAAEEREASPLNQPAAQKIIETKTHTITNTPPPSEVKITWASEVERLQTKKYESAAEARYEFTEAMNRLALDQSLSYDEIIATRERLTSLEEEKINELPKTEIVSYSSRLLDPTDPNKGVLLEPNMK